MFKIQFRVAKSFTYKKLECCEIIDSGVILWKIKKNKYDLGPNRLSLKVYTKYKSIFNYDIIPVNYSGKILFCEEDNGYKRTHIIPLLMGKLDGYSYYFVDEQLCGIRKNYRGKSNTSFEIHGDNIYIYYNFLSDRYFYFTETGKLESFENNLNKIEYEFYLNGKIKSYTKFNSAKHKGKHFKFTEN